MLANRVLADNLPTGVSVSPSQANSAVGRINDFVDECVLFIHCDNAASAHIVRLSPLDSGSGAAGSSDLSGPSMFRIGRIQVSEGRRAATIEFTLPAPGRIDVSVYDVLGRRISQLERDVTTAGAQTETVNLGDRGGIRSGIYLVRIRLIPDGSGGEQVESRKFVVTR